jgi:hypothetical protein
MVKDKNEIEAIRAQTDGRTMPERWRHLARHGTAAHLTPMRLALDEAADVVERLSGGVRVLPPAEECTRTETCECVGCVASMHGGDLPPDCVERSPAPDGPRAQADPDLAAIRARLVAFAAGAGYSKVWPEEGFNGIHNPRAVRADVAALLAEVERLTAELTNSRRAWHGAENECKRLTAELADSRRTRGGA